MTDQDTEAEAPVPITSEERLRALTSDRKRKAKGQAKSVPGDAAHRPGDLVDAVRERSKDSGRDTPL